MSFLGKVGKIFGNNGGSVASTASATRSVAKERLSVILASQRGSELLEGIDMEALQQDVFKVVQKHVTLAENRPIRMNVNNDGNVSLFEMSVELQSQPRVVGSSQGATS
mmetsp:Transcript_2175/g.3231  ORF Transcript_2175/g.3231 Transcript_2175/m.3231 type:complete len:109 (+) Transcript_2175:146-472(+)|eukprot:CAMPEP_0194201122 /NCGR_PEP_ID=MMETSP0156-20130528/1481_1 /TAXON_ID=33649 /ORGANISM="Thalassionema nitzschioides, Strain L26-B" /LENGTH=108 /DNA_ID=CAMNT_0038926237 /DNA_START=115 /DNA_END=441 /DNA_ORIENTATION=-